jgi:hypothetical protein
MRCVPLTCPEADADEWQLMAASVSTQTGQEAAFQ